MLSKAPILRYLCPRAASIFTVSRHAVKYTTATRLNSDAPLQSSSSPTVASPPPAPRLKSQPPPSKRASKSSHKSNRQAPSAAVPAYSVPGPPATSAWNRFASPAPNSSADLTDSPYFVARSPSNQLPVYKVAKRGGNLHQTRIRKISGNLDVLRAEVQAFLDLPEKECVINRTTGHIVLKGWHVRKVMQFLASKGF